MIPPRETSRLESLDSLRGIAALAVLLGHTAGAFVWPHQWTQFPLLNVMFDGRSAVTMFFVLSGFVLSRPYLNARPQLPPRNLKIPTFYLRRFTRIWIPWFCVFLASLASQHWLFPGPETIPPQTEWLQGFWHHRPDAWEFLRQCAFSLHDAHRLLLPQDWSLGVELKGSALVPIFIWLARRNLVLLGIVGGALLVVLPTGYYYFGFVFGVFLAAYHQRGTDLMRRLNLPLKAAVLCLGICLYQIRLAAGSFGPIDALMERIVWTLASVGCVLIILASLASERLQKILRHAGLVFMGRISYSVYLFQFIVLLCLLPRFVLWLDQRGLTNPAIILPLAMVFTLLVNTALAAACYRLVEIPAIALGHKLTELYGRAFGKPAAQVPG